MATPPRYYIGTACSAKSTIRTEKKRMRLNQNMNRLYFSEFFWIVTNTPTRGYFALCYIVWFFVFKHILLKCQKWKYSTKKHPIHVLMHRSRFTATSIALCVTSSVCFLSFIFWPPYSLYFDLEPLKFLVLSLSMYLIINERKNLFNDITMSCIRMQWCDTLPFWNTVSIR